jgi:hypothetical protein
MTRRRISANASSCRGCRSGSPISSRASFGVRFTLIVTSMVVAFPQAMKLRSSNATPSSFCPIALKARLPACPLVGRVRFFRMRKCSRLNQPADPLTARRILPAIRRAIGGSARAGRLRTPTISSLPRFGRKMKVRTGHRMPRFGQTNEIHLAEKLSSTSWS